MSDFMFFRLGPEGTPCYVRRDSIVAVCEAQDLMTSDGTTVGTRIYTTSAFGPWLPQPLDEVIELLQAEEAA